MSYPWIPVLMFNNQTLQGQKICIYQISKSIPTKKFNIKHWRKFMSFQKSYFVDYNYNNLLIIEIIIYLINKMKIIIFSRFIYLYNIEITIWINNLETRKNWLNLKFSISIFAQDRCRDWKMEDKLNSLYTILSWTINYCYNYLYQVSI